MKNTRKKMEKWTKQIKQIEDEQKEAALIQMCLQRDWERRKYILQEKVNRKIHGPRCQASKILSYADFTKLRYKQYDFFAQQLGQMCDSCIIEQCEERHILLDNRDERHQDLEMALIHAEMYKRRIYFSNLDSKKKQCTCRHGKKLLQN